MRSQAIAGHHALLSFSAKVHLLALAAFPRGEPSAMKALQPPTEALYKALTPDQQERAAVVLLLLGSTGGGVSFEH
jgi:hypothetical protein